MARGFSLAGLLRLRQIQQDAAANSVALANERVRETALRRARARVELGETTTNPEDALTLTAIAAARASTRSMLAELDAVTAIQSRAADDARHELNAARARSIGLEKLADKHATALAALDLRAEQTVLDELAGTAWHRTNEGRVG